MSELRWNPLLQEWTITAPHRQDRPVLQECPFCTEIEGTPEDVRPVALPNRFPALSHRPPTPAVSSLGPWTARSSYGRCEILLYTADHDTALADLPLGVVQGVIGLWRSRYLELEGQEHVRYVFIFENRGEAVGVSLSHPHGQLYALPVVPPVVEREMESMRAYSESDGGCLLCDILEMELENQRRIVALADGYVALVPFWARWPYEVHILPRGHASALIDVEERKDAGLASLIRRILKKYDNLFEQEMPYVMVLHQRPVDGKEYPDYHFHIEIYPFKRSRTHLKYLAGCELGAGVFLNDSHPEETAAELIQVPPG